MSFLIYFTIEGGGLSFFTFLGGNVTKEERDTRGEKARPPYLLSFSFSSSSIHCHVHLREQSWLFIRNLHLMLTIPFASLSPTNTHHRHTQKTMSIIFPAVTNMPTILYFFLLFFLIISLNDNARSSARVLGGAGGAGEENNHFYLQVGAWTLPSPIFSSQFFKFSNKLMIVLYLQNNAYHKISVTTTTTVSDNAADASGTGGRQDLENAVEKGSAGSYSWSVPRQKDGDKHPGFNLDYSAPKTHPPSHNWRRRRRRINGS